MIYRTRSGALQDSRFVEHLETSRKLIKGELCSRPSLHYEREHKKWRWRVWSILIIHLNKIWWTEYGRQTSREESLEKLNFRFKYFSSFSIHNLSCSIRATGNCRWPFNSQSVSKVRTGEFSWKALVRTRTDNDVRLPFLRLDSISWVGRNINFRNYIFLRVN